MLGLYVKSNEQFSRFSLGISTSPKIEILLFQYIM